MSKPGDYSKASSLDVKELQAQAKKTLGELAAIDPNNVICMMGMVVYADGGIKLLMESAEHDPEGKTEVRMHGFALGNDTDIARMFVSLAETVKNGIVAVNTPQDNSSEVKH
jgi:hypothetical protein